MSTCVPTPVSTVFSTVTENIIATTYSLSTSTTPPVVTARVDPYCQDEAVLLDSAVCLRTATRTTTETLQRTFPPSWFAPLSSRISCLVLFCLFQLGFRKTDCVFILSRSNSFTRNNCVQ